MKTGTLYFFCGKMGAGKSTHSAALAEETNAVRISEDEWLALLFPDLINTIEDYRVYSEKLKPLFSPKVSLFVMLGCSSISGISSRVDAKTIGSLRPSE